MAAMVANGHGQCYRTMHLGQGLPSFIEREPKLQGKFRIPLKRRLVLHHTVRVHSLQAGFGRGTFKVKEEESQEEDFKSEPAGGTRKFFNLPGTVKLQGSSQSKPKSGAKSNRVIFVAGATGKVGSRTVRELLKLGFEVRASTRNVEKAQAMFEDAVQTVSADAQSNNGGPFEIFSPAKLFGFLNPKPAKLLEIVKCDLEVAESIETAVGNAGVVVCCIGASEKEVLDVTGPYRIDFKATKNLIEAASSAQVNHFVLLTSLGTQKIGFPAAVLNLFWGVLVWKAKAEEALIESGLSYTIVRPGGMERPTDAYKETHNLRLAEADKLFGGQVSNLQVAELLACIVENPDVSMNKIVEVVAETTAPLRPIRELLEEIPASDIPVEIPKTKKASSGKVQVAAQRASKKSAEKSVEDRGRQEEEKRIQAKILAEQEQERIRAQKLAEEKRVKAEKEREETERLKAEDLRKQYEEEIKTAREKEEAAKAAATAAFAGKAELEKRVADIRAKAEAAVLAASQAKAVEAAVLAAARRGNVLSEEEKAKIVEAVRLERMPKAGGVKETAVSSKKKPPFPFLGWAAPSKTVPETLTEASIEDEVKTEVVKTDTQAKAKAKAEEMKRQEEEEMKKEVAKKLAEEEAARAVDAKRKEEQEKLEKEATEVLAEQVAAKAAAEEKKKEEEEDAKRKEEQEKLEKEAKRILAEQVAAKAAAEEKKKEEAKKDEQEEADRLKAEAEEKAKVLAEQEAAVKAEAEKQKEEGASKEVEAAPQPAPLKGFRWFWERADPDGPEEGSKTTPTADATEVLVETRAMELPPSSTPLSPYTRYPGLKPPSSPVPSPPRVAKKPEAGTPSPSPTSSGADKEASKREEMAVPEDVATGKDTETTEDVDARKKLVMDVIAREREALEKAQAATSFLWPWQKKSEPPLVTEPSVLTTAEVQPKSEQTLPSSIEAIAEEMKPLPRSPRPLSPYSMYPGLKPPSPPIRSLPKTEPASQPKSDTLSPEINNVEQDQDKVEFLLEKDNDRVSKEELSKEPEDDIEARRLQVQETIAREREALEKAKAANSFVWPWQKTEEEPVAPINTKEGSAVVNKEEEPIASPQEPAKVETGTLQASSRPLSPYIQYADLKPPGPPTPWCPALVKSDAEEPRAAEASSSNPLSTYSGFPELKSPTSSAPSQIEEPENGAGPSSAQEASEEVTEPAVASSGFKWPWQ